MRGIGGEVGDAIRSLIPLPPAKTFSEIRLSNYFSWSHQTYWDAPQSDRYRFLQIDILILAIGEIYPQQFL